MNMDRCPATARLETQPHSPAMNRMIIIPVPTVLAGCRRLISGWLLPLLAASAGITAEPGPVRLVANSKDASPGAYMIATPIAAYHLEKTGGGLSSMVDRDGRDWLSFHPAPGSGAGGEYRGFPNAVHQQAGNYFHPRNQKTDPCTLTVERIKPDQVTISSLSSNGLWACTYDFFATHCTFTMTRMPPDKKYWVLYEGTPGGQYDDDDWWMTSAVKTPQPMTVNHEGDIPAPEWIAFGDPRLNRTLVLWHHEDDAFPDSFYQMERKMTVFGFGRKKTQKFQNAVPQRFSIGFLETTNSAAVSQALSKWDKKQAK
jgi:hypothetical protein